MSLERDIIQKIEETFSPQNARIAVELLIAAGRSGGVARCIVVAAKGSLEKSRQYLQVAHDDWRDVITAGEYDGDPQIFRRDLSVSFLIDEPVKMWIAAVAGTLAMRGYSLSSIETVPVAHPVARESGTFLSDLGEGTATFDGDLGQIRVTKRDGRWTLKGDPAELQL